MTTALFIFYTPSWQPLADIVLPVAQRYCEKHGYDLCDTYMADSMLDGKPVGYYKMKALRYLLKKYSLIWVLDCDALITNDEIDVSFFNSFGTDIFFTEDVHGINAGSFLIRCTDASKRFIDAVIDDFDAPEEQTIMKRHIKMVKVCTLPHPSINSYLYSEYLHDWGNLVGEGIQMPTHEQGNWAPGDFVLHLPGLGLERRCEVFKEVIKTL